MNKIFSQIWPKKLTLLQWLKMRKKMRLKNEKKNGAKKWTKIDEKNDKNLTPKNLLRKFKIKKIHHFWKNSPFSTQKNIWEGPFYSLSLLEGPKLPPIPGRYTRLGVLKNRPILKRVFWTFFKIRFSGGYNHRSKKTRFLKMRKINDFFFKFLPKNCTFPPFWRILQKNPDFSEISLQFDHFPQMWHILID